MGFSLAMSLFNDEKTNKSPPSEGIVLADARCKCLLKKTISTTQLPSYALSSFKQTLQRTYSAPRVVFE